MYIKRIVLENFKIFKGEHSFEFSPGINYLVGENNVGKTTIFDAVQFMINKSSRDDYIYNEYINDKEKNVSVTIELANCLPLSESTMKYQNYVFGENNIIKIKKSSKETCIDNKKYGIRNVLTYNYEKESYENPTGASSTISDLLNCEFVYAHQHNEEARDFSNNKTLGKLINQVTSDFQQSIIFKEYKSLHESTFGENGIKKYLSNIENQLSNIIADQFGDSTVKFEFEFPKFNDLLKKGSVNVEEQGIVTNICDKGNGLQRALLLALIQLSAEYNKKGNDNLLYFIDEPELYLHPRAHNKLLNSLNDLSEKGSQVFITTHSPYSFTYYGSNSKVYILQRIGDKIQCEDMNELTLSEVTMGEITYRAFKIPNVEFHHRLFSDAYEMWLDIEEREDKSLALFDEKYLQKYCKTKKEYIPKYKGKWKNSKLRTLPYIIRNCQDHPEVMEKNHYSEEDLRESIEDLISIYNQLKTENI